MIESVLLHYSEDYLRAPIAARGAIHRETWPEQAELYAGQHGRLPAVGDAIHAWNFWDCTSRIGKVASVNSRTRTYVVTLGEEG